MTTVTGWASELVGDRLRQFAAGRARASPVAKLSRIAQLDQRTAATDQCLHSAEADVRPQGGSPGLTH